MMHHSLSLSFGLRSAWPRSNQLRLTNFQARYISYICFADGAMCAVCVRRY